MGMTEFDDMPDLKSSMFAIAALFRIHFICYLPKGRLKTVRLVLAKFLLKSNALSLSDDIAMQAHTLVWFRRNLRIRDNAALSAAVKRGLPVAGVWVARRSSEIPNPRQDWFHYQAAAALHGSLAARGVALYAVSRVEELPALATRLNVQTVIADEAYTSSEIGQDNRIWRILDEQGVAFERVNDRAIFAKAEIMGSHGAPYTDFPHYKEAWLALFRQRFGGQDAVCRQTEIFQTTSAEMPLFPAWNGQQDMVSAQRGGEDVDAGRGARPGTPGTRTRSGALRVPGRVAGRDPRGRRPGSRDVRERLHRAWGSTADHPFRRRTLDDLTHPGRPVRRTRDRGFPQPTKGVE